MDEASVEDLIVACRSATLDVGALAWVAGPLSNHLRRAKPFPPVPPTLARKSGVKADMAGPEDLTAVALHLVRHVAGRCLPPARAARMSVGDVVAAADDVAKREIKRASERADRLSEGDMASALLSKPDAAWSSPWTGNVRVNIGLGRLAALVEFSELSEGRWVCGWKLSRPTRELVERMAHGRRCGPGAGTGLFPKIDAALRQATEEFVRRYQPGSLEIYGDDDRRNAHNVRAYGGLLPEDYALRLVRRQGEGEDGSLAGIALVRSPEAAPALTDPLVPQIDRRFPDEGRDKIPGDWCEQPPFEAGHSSSPTGP